MPESLFNKVAGLRPATLLKKTLQHRCFPENFALFQRTLFLHNTSGRLLLFSCPIFLDFLTFFHRFCPRLQVLFSPICNQKPSMSFTFFYSFEGVLCDYQNYKTSTENEQIALLYYFIEVMKESGSSLQSL